MESRAVTKYIRRSPKKIRGIANEIRGMIVSDAVSYLEHVPNMGALNLRKTILSASANAAMKNPDINTDQLVIKELCVDQGPSFKRVKPRARGRADRIVKKTSHISVILSDDLKNKAAGTGKKWVFPDEKTPGIIEIMRKKKRKGPLWHLIT